ncbi:low affinity immunoglobulin gamma Fc region receptor II-like isoform X1 [Thunnus maccoyii]|uniref:low affinity immunoglobulin gamma Fc region receptor II-like isoform X1 n=1 Tax=Thunnus maccoyii TaxID=8240 RepID=UPI001C4C9E3D|nr:low affinity immunoglobulin gamma Fc region receptor II-like isoform X1 [Thunnus maccoyii]
MKSSSVRLLLGVSVLLLSGPTVSAVSLSVRPNLQQFFRRSTLTLRCDEDGQTADGWTVKRTAGGETEQCGNSKQNFGRIEGSSCIISTLLLSDSGVYWCENSSGKISEHINITVTGGQLILEVPALPVLTGSDVTLRCRSRDGSTQAANLFKNGEPSRAGSTGEFTISNVQQSDEGFYSCYAELFAESPRSRLRVKASPHPPPPPPPTSSSSSPPPSRPSSPVSVDRGLALSLLCHLVVVCPFCISTVLMVSIYCSRRTGNTPAVSMEMPQRAGGGQGLDGVYDDITADVTTEYDF